MHADIRPGSDRPPRARAASLRPAGAARLLSGNAASSADSAGFMVAMMLVPTGVTAAALASSVIWKIVVAPSKIDGMAFDMEGEDGRADHDDEIVVAQRIRELSGRGRAGSPRIADAAPGNEQRAENGLTQTAALAFSATFTIRSTASARSTAGPTTKAGCLLAEARPTSAFIASASGPISRLTWRAANGCAGCIQSSIGTETKVGPQGGCIAV